MKSDELNATISCCSEAIRREKAAKLLERFHQAGIAFRTQPRTPPPEPLSTVLIDISVGSTRAGEVAQIHRDLFGN
jgi:hypothetical protein